MAVSHTNEPLEREAGAAVDRVLRGSAPARLAGRAAQPASRGGGSALPEASRAFMEERFGADFSGVRVHSGAAAAGFAGALHANAVTIGSDIYFSPGHFSPESESGQRLLAHELAHTLQQSAGAPPQIQRDCGDPTFCTPLDNYAAAARAKALLRTVYLPADETTWGPNSRMLYERFLDRSPGDSLAPVVFDTPANDVVTSFATSWATSDDQDAIIDLVGERLSRVSLSDNVLTMMPIGDFLTPSELDFRDITYSNPLSIAGHLAGGISSSDAGPDYRKVTRGNVSLTRTPLVAGTGYTTVETTLHYEVGDAVDFCPGDCGSLAEQMVTVPMSRLEASGLAYDVPFVVRFVPESRSKRFWF
jgi:hypothetical protein